MMVLYGRCSCTSVGTGPSGTWKGATLLTGGPIISIIQAPRVIYSNMFDVFDIHQVGQFRIHYRFDLGHSHGTRGPDFGLRDQEPPASGQICLCLCGQHAAGTSCGGTGASPVPFPPPNQLEVAPPWWGKNDGACNPFPKSNSCRFASSDAFQDNLHA